MKNFSKIFLFIFTLFIFSNGVAQEKTTEKGYQFKDTKVIEHTSVKNQNRSSTCWSFSGLSFIENELIRMGKGHFDLSEMWIVNRAYYHKADIYVRMHGNFNFGPGGGFFDVLEMPRLYGFLPEEAYTGAQYGESLPLHSELDHLLKAYVDVIVKNPNKKLSTAWKEGLEGVLSAYLGEVPETFTYKGVEYTPASFTEMLNINFSDYVSITSFTHHPFYNTFALEIPDNWMMEDSYNVTLEELMSVIDNSLAQGYTVAWGADVSHKGFSWKNGVAVIPTTEFEETSGSDRERWESLSQTNKDKQIYAFDKPGKEQTITQQIRQEGFDNYSTTDDHGMVIVGTATDQNGTLYYKVKNSWGTDERNPYQGYFYASVPFMQMQTINVMVHKDAIPASLKKKLNL